MVYSEAAFSRFIDVNGGVFPYDSVLHTRRLFHPKWLLLRTNCETGSVERPRNVFCLASSCVSKNELQCMIMSKSALPVPHEYDCIINVMEWWGRGVSGVWQQAILNMLYESMICNRPFTTKYAMYACLKVLLGQKMDLLTSNTLISWPTRERMLDDFHKQFLYMYETITHDYYHLCVMGIQYMEDLLLELEINSPSSTHAISVESTDRVASHTHVIPESPCSSQS